jgi:hypothetical protein
MMEILKSTARGLVNLDSRMMRRDTGFEYVGGGGCFEKKMPEVYQPTISGHRQQGDSGEGKREHPKWLGS